MRYVIAAYLATLGALVAVAIAGGVVVLDASGPDGPLESTADQYGHRLWQWELRHFPEKWLYKIGGLVSGRDAGDDDAALREYFDLTEEMAALTDDDTALVRLEAERADLENRVEDIIEGRATRILEEQGLTMGPPPFKDLDLVFPPVDFEFDQPPRVLVTSPRDRIELTHDYLLRHGISRDQIAGIEADAEEEPNTSALVATTGGVSTYPSVEDNLDGYDHLVEVVFHEWTHSYLVFYPLGSRYFESSELRTLNETVASVAGDQLAAAYFAKYGRLDGEPEPSAPPEASPAPSAAPPEFDFVAEMRALRREVEAMLAEGQIEGAEALMEARRVEFGEQGYRIRRLNQAYFAFYGFYGTGAGSIDPIGPKVEQLFASTQTPGEFLRQARALKSQSDLDALLERLSSG